MWKLLKTSELFLFNGTPSGPMRIGKIPSTFLVSSSSSSSTASTFAASASPSSFPYSPALYGSILVPLA
jgi:hypothetical protein